MEAHLVQRAHGRKADDGLVGGQEELQQGDCGGELSRGHVLEVADCPGSLKDDHLCLQGSSAAE